MATEWNDVTQDVLDLCEELIEEYHPDLGAAKIGLVFRSEAGKANGREVWGQAKKVSSKDYHFIKLDFIIWLAQDVWELRLSPLQRRALLDHELCHLRFDDDEMKASTRGHDLEEFACIIERYGIWRFDVERVARAIQPHLPFEEPGSPLGQTRNGAVIRLPIEHAAERLGQAADAIRRGDFPSASVERVPAIEMD